ncbi:hypothetical protein SEA_LEWAN_88 [Mycobacterium phage Lewan]|nr:hypothetical protein SEA_LEWAN_88 [Mycobacterium phage Lewan]
MIFYNRAVVTDLSPERIPMEIRTTADLIIAGGVVVKNRYGNVGMNANEL